MVNNDFSHIIFTRYNVKNISNSFLKDKHKQLTLTPKWHASRYTLFANYCLPSIVHQSKHNFFWFIFFDQDTDPEYFKKIKALTSPYEFITLFLVIDAEDMVDQIYTLSRKLLNENGHRFLITTRFDNDDALREDAVEVIQGHFEHQQFELIHLAKGYTFNTITKVAYLQEITSGPFYSLIEKVEKGRIPKTVFLGTHEAMADIPRKNISSNPYWCQIIHKENIANEDNGKLVQSNDFLKQFHVNIDIQDASLFQRLKSLYLNRLVFWPMQKIKKNYYYLRSKM